MATRNGLTTAPGLFASGSPSSYIYEKRGNSSFSGEITVTDSAGDVATLIPDTLIVRNGSTNGTFSVGQSNTLEISTDANSDIDLYPGTGVINLGANELGQNTAQLQVTDLNQLYLTSYGSIVLVPNADSGSGTGGFTLQDGVTNPAIANLEVYDMLPSITNAVLRAQTMKPFFAGSGGPLNLDQTKIGQTIQITNDVNTVNLPAANTVPAGTIYDIYMAPLDAGATGNVVFLQGANTIATVPQLNNGKYQYARCFTPNQGVTWFVFVESSFNPS
jgi:hypothetical protein